MSLEQGSYEFENLSNEIQDAIVYDGQLPLRQKLSERFDALELNVIFEGLEKTYNVILQTNDATGIKNEETECFRYFPKYILLDDKDNCLRIYIRSAFEIGAICRVNYDIMQKILKLGSSVNIDSHY